MLAAAYAVNLRLLFYPRFSKYTGKNHQGYGSPRLLFFAQQNFRASIDRPKLL